MLLCCCDDNQSSCGTLSNFGIVNLLNMGADCCGGGSPADAAAQAVADMSLDAAPKSKLPEDTRPWEQIAEEKKPYYLRRIDLFAAIKARQDASLEAAKQANVPIKVILPDGSEKPGVKGVTSPLDIANLISKSLAKKIVVAKVDGDVWDLARPLEGDCALQLLNFEDPEGKEVRANLLPSRPYQHHMSSRRSSTLHLLQPSSLYRRLSGTLAPTSSDKPLNSNSEQISPSVQPSKKAFTTIAILATDLSPTSKRIASSKECKTQSKSASPLSA